MMPRVPVLALLCLSPVLAHAQAPGWVADPQTGCRVWAGRAGPGAGVTWTGACADGYASGRGAVTWANGNRYDGDMKGGKYEGKGVFTFANGIQYDGELKDGKPNGQGTLTRPDGQIFRGAWNNGCYRQGNRWSAVMVTPQDCGMHQ
jgi:hypothetical protein